jgi:hypothetical protein
VAHAVVHAAQGRGETYTEVLTLYVRLYSEPLLQGSPQPPLTPVAGAPNAHAFEERAAE